MKDARDAALVYINGQRHEVRGEQAFMMLADYLRYECGLVGTKIVCAEGDCGACTVLRFAPFRSEGFEAINACIVFLAQLDGAQIVSIEGLQDGARLSKVQEAIVRCHGTQCGYCTPGFAMALTACMEKRLKAKSKISGEPADQLPLTPQAAKNQMTGNLCRCTGYSPLIEAAIQADAVYGPSLEARYLRPAHTRDIKKHLALPLHIVEGERHFFAPTSLEELWRLRRRYPEARIVAGATDLGVQINKGESQAQTWFSLHLLPELYRLQKTGKRLHIGARVSLAAVRRICEDLVPEFAAFLNIFASPQIKNMGTLVGNIANASPIGDTLPFLLVADAVVHISGPRGERELPLHELYQGYRQLALKPAELITGLSFHQPKRNARLKLYKASQRRDLDISTVSGAFLLELSEKQPQTIQTARIAFGGVGPVAQRCKAVENYLQAKTLNHATIDEASRLVQTAIAPLSDLRGSAAYRRALAEGFFRRYCAELGAKQHEV